MVTLRRGVLETVRDRASGSATRRRSDHRTLRRCSRLDAPSPRRGDAPTVDGSTVKPRNRPGISLERLVRILDRDQRRRSPLSKAADNYFERLIVALQ